MSTAVLALMLAAMIGGLVAALALLRFALHKRCPQCGRRTVGRHGLDVQNVEPRVFRIYECVRCRIDYASADGRTLVPRDQWDAGVRDPAPRATVVRGGS